MSGTTTSSFGPNFNSNFNRAGSQFMQDEQCIDLSDEDDDRTTIVAADELDDQLPNLHKTRPSKSRPKSVVQSRNNNSKGSKTIL